MVLRLFIFLIPFIAFADQYNPGYLGEKNSLDYQGHRDPFFSFDSYHGDLIWEDRNIDLKYFEGLTSNEFEQLRSLSYEVTNATSCPHFVINKHFDYLRYSHRLITLSYLFESLRYRNFVAKKLNQKKRCNVNWKKVINSCSPKSTDMKSFLKNANRALDYIKPLRVPGDFSSRKFRKRWMKSLKRKYGTDPASTRVQLSCKDCNKLPFKKTIRALDNTCIEDEKLFKKICSEKDSLYGLSNVQEPYFLISRSNITRVFDEGGYATGCLRRFSEQFRHKEKEYHQLKNIFSTTYNSINSSKDKNNIQGKLFLAGALREFTQKGLKSIYEEKKEIKVAKVEEVQVLEKLIPKVEKNKIKKIEKKKTIKLAVKKAKKKRAVDKRTAFLKAVQYREKVNLDYIFVDMLRFKYDLQFSLKVLNLLEKNVANYLSYSALKEMKEYDNLGSPHGPVPLIFLKYLIDTGKHQGLYNILNVLGNKFFVNNDIDKAPVAPYDYIELRNDSTTNFNWQIVILKYSK